MPEPTKRKVKQNPANSPPLATARDDVARAPFAPSANEVHLILFWGSWCHSCKALFWDLDKNLPTFWKSSIKIIAVDESPEPPLTALEKHPLREKIKKQLYFDRNRCSEKIWNIVSTPTILLVREGHPTVRWQGHLNASDWQTLLGSLKGLNLGTSTKKG